MKKYSYFLYTYEHDGEKLNTTLSMKQSFYKSGLMKNDV